MIAVLLITFAVARTTDAQDWAAFPPAAECRAVVALDTGVDTAAVRAGIGTLIVRPLRFDTKEPVSHVRATLTPVGVPPQRQSGPYDIDSSVVRAFRELAVGQYVLTVRRLGLYMRIDTVTVRPGAVDTVAVALEHFHEGYRNTHNCRPRGFRRAGESACVTDSAITDNALWYARELAGPSEDRDFPRIPVVELAEIRLVSDEAVCERAGREYGSPDDPPRRVVVVRMGELFLVYDPYEPEAAGEFNIWMIFDRNWQEVVGIAS